MHGPVHMWLHCVSSPSFSLKPPPRVKTEASPPRDRGGNRRLGDSPPFRDKPHSPPESVTVRAVFPVASPLAWGRIPPVQGTRRAVHMWVTLCTNVPVSATTMCIGVRCSRGTKLTSQVTLRPSLTLQFRVTQRRGLCV